MQGGTPINRQWVFVLKDGSIVIDWGDGLYQEVHTGDFLRIDESQISHHVTDEELDWLKRIGRVTSFTAQTIWFPNLPERARHTID